MCSTSGFLGIGSNEGREGRKNEIVAEGKEGRKNERKKQASK
jgi:hypothetical protein